MPALLRAFCLIEEGGLISGFFFLLGFAEGGAATGEIGVFGAITPGEQAFNGEDLNFWVILLQGGVVVTGGEGFLAHGVGGFSEGDEEAHCGFFTLNGVFEVGEHGAGDVVSAFDGDDDFLGGFGVIHEEDDAIGAAISAFLFALVGLGVDEGTRPPLELVFVSQGEVGGTGEIGGGAVDFKLGVGEGVLHAFFDEGDGEVGDVDADPVAVEFLGGVDGGAAAAEGVEDEIAGVGGGEEDAYEEGEGFLGGVAEAFGGLGIYWENISNDILHRNAWSFIQIPFNSNTSIFCKVQLTFCIKFNHGF